MIQILDRILLLIIFLIYGFQLFFDIDNINYFRYIVILLFWINFKLYSKDNE